MSTVDRNLITENVRTIPWQEIQRGPLIGEGGFGQVFRGRWDDKDIAIKQLFLKTLSPHLIKDFKNETNIMVQCSQCFQIVRLYGICMEPERYAMVMEYMSQGSLYQVLHDETKDLPWAPIRIQMAIDIGKGLSYLHEREILHRDLKSLNILVDEEFHAKISDFGLSKIKLESNSSTLNSTNPKTGAGTIRWKAPELLKLNPVHSKASDIYAYGMVLWEIASRRLPFGEAEDSIIVSSVKTGEQETIPEETPPEYGKLVKRTWTLEPMNRPSPHFIVHALEKLKPKPKTKSWNFDLETISIDLGNKKYSLIQATPLEKEKILKFYSHHPVPGYEIASIKMIYNPQFDTIFSAYMAKLQERFQNPAFDPKWSWEMENPEWRKTVYDMAIDLAKPYTDPDYPAVKLYPMWHGTNPAIVDSICRAGYASLAITDVGFFGKGLYSAHEAEYAYRVYSKGALVLNWVAVFSPYPVIDGDIVKLTGKANYQNYDAHFIPVSPKDPNNPNEANYYPCKPFTEHSYTEVVVFESAACLPRYLVELQPLMTKQPSFLPPPPIPINTSSNTTKSSDLPTTLSTSSERHKSEGSSTIKMGGNRPTLKYNSTERSISIGAPPPQISLMKEGVTSPHRSSWAGEKYPEKFSASVPTIATSNLEGKSEKGAKPIPPPKPPRKETTTKVTTIEVSSPKFQSSPTQKLDSSKTSSSEDKGQAELMNISLNQPDQLFNLGKKYFDGNQVKKDYGQAFKYFRQAATKGFSDAEFYLGLFFHYGYGTEENLKLALKYFQLAADRGQKMALFYLARCYSSGTGLIKDEETAHKYFKVAQELGVLQFLQDAADQGDVQAQFDLSHCYKEGIFVKQDYAIAVKYLQRAADHGFSSAQFNLGGYYFKGQGVVRSHENAVKYFQLAADQGDAGAQYNLAYCYDKGLGVRQNQEMAFKWYKQAADRGHLDAQYSLGICYYQGQGTPVKEDRAAQYFHLAAEKGHKHAQYNLGICYQKGKGLPKDLKLAFENFKAAADQEQVSAQCSVGICFLYGQGVQYNPKEAVSYFQSAASQNNMVAQFYLGRCFKKGMGYEKNENLGNQFIDLALKRGVIDYLKQLAEQEDAQAQFDLGNCYFDGIGERQDYPFAVKYYQLAADQGHSSAQYNLGVCYFKGIGVKQDPKKAFHYFELSADQGDASAQGMLGFCYDRGLGTKQNHKKAFEYFERAANQENVEGLYNLGICYYQAQGTTKDVNKAKNLFQKAAALGHAQAKEQLTKIENS